MIGDASYDGEGGPAGVPWPPPAAASTPETRESADQHDVSAPALPGPTPPTSASPETPPPPTPAPPPPEPTGDERVDAALARFDELTAAPVAEHVDVFEDVHRRLQDVLAAMDHDHEERPAGGSAPRPRPDPPSRDV
ncbi:MAG TPA: hypothetical protein VFU43_09090 [Streptosporangiaceae bacterium]|nr:hypothetical protein [Streptosporangiaceae bacterium]